MDARTVLGEADDISLLIPAHFRTLAFRLHTQVPWARDRVITASWVSGFCPARRVLLLRQPPQDSHF